MLLTRRPHALPSVTPRNRSPSRRPRFTLLLMLAGAFGSALSILVITVDGALRSGYSAVSNTISDLARPPHA